ncbi:ArsR/SmtB family transcription factor [Chloroflexota bacterium]
MPPDTDFIIAPEIATVNVALEPVYNAVGSLRLLSWTQEAKYAAGINPWVMRTLDALTPDQWHTHLLVIQGLYYMVDPQASWASFPAYIEHLASVPAITLRDKLVKAYLDLGCRKNYADSTLETPTEEALLASKENYLGFLGAAFPKAFDAQLETEAYDLILDLPRMQETVVSHLSMMWDNFLAEEWARVKPMLQESVDAFRQIDLNSMSNFAAAEYVIGQKLDDQWLQWMDHYQYLTLIPSPHIGAYQGSFYADDTLCFMYGVRMPAGMHSSQSALSRAELLVRLNALADDTRLMVLALIAEDGEMCAQDVKTRLNLSQSAASRHLKQLSANGFLIERKQENAKCYSLNPKQLNGTLAALQQFLNLR